MPCLLMYGIFFIACVPKAGEDKKQGICRILSPWRGIKGVERKGCFFTPLPPDKYRDGISPNQGRKLRLIFATKLLN